MPVAQEQSIAHLNRFHAGSLVTRDLDHLYLMLSPLNEALPFMIKSCICEAPLYAFIVVLSGDCGKLKEVFCSVVKRHASRSEINRVYTPRCGSICKTYCKILVMAKAA
jgi:hypothetical protein